MNNPRRARPAFGASLMAILLTGAVAQQPESKMNGASDGAPLKLVITSSKQRVMLNESFVLEARIVNVSGERRRYSGSCSGAMLVDSRFIYLTRAGGQLRRSSTTTTWLFLLCWATPHLTLCSFPTTSWASTVRIRRRICSADRVPIRCSLNIRARFPSVTGRRRTSGAGKRVRFDQHRFGLK